MDVTNIGKAKEWFGVLQTSNQSQTAMMNAPAGVKHRFVNRGDTPTVTFNVYSPPAYARETKG